MQSSESPDIRRTQSDLKLIKAQAKKVVKKVENKRFNSTMKLKKQDSTVTLGTPRMSNRVST